METLVFRFSVYQTFKKCIVFAISPQNINENIDIAIVNPTTFKNKSTLDNSPPPLLKLKLLMRPQGQIIDVKCEKSH